MAITESLFVTFVAISQDVAIYNTIVSRKEGTCRKQLVLFLSVIQPMKWNEDVIIAVVIAI